MPPRRTAATASLPTSAASLVGHAMLETLAFVMRQFPVPAGHEDNCDGVVGADGAVKAKNDTGQRPLLRCNGESRTSGEMDVSPALSRKRSVRPLPADVLSIVDVVRRSAHRRAGEARHRNADERCYESGSRGGRKCPHDPSPLRLLAFHTKTPSWINFAEGRRAALTMAESHLLSSWARATPLMDDEAC